MNLAQFAALVGPPVATLLAIFALVVVRGAKVSEFRQKWIDDQRTDLATILAESSRWSGSVPATDLVPFDLAASRIKLREKPPATGGRKLWLRLTRRTVGPEWGEAIAAIDALRSALAGTPTRSATIAEIQEELIAQSRIRLKGEWERVRSGETGYKTLLLLAALLAAAPLLPLAASVLDLVVQTGNMPSPREMLTHSGLDPDK